MKPWERDWGTQATGGAEQPTGPKPWERDWSAGSGPGAEDPGPDRNRIEDAPAPARKAKEPVARPYEPNIFERTKDFLGITERRKDAAKARADIDRLAARAGLTADEYAASVGGNPSLYAPSDATPIDFAQDVATASKYMGWKAGLEQLIAGYDPKAVAQNAELLEEQRRRDKEFAAYGGSGARYAFGLNSDKIASSLQSLPFSIYSQMAYLVGAIPGAVLKSGLIAHGGGAALSAPVAYRMDAANVLSQLHSAANTEFKRQVGRDMTPDEFAKFAAQPEIESAVRTHALAEAGFESLGNFLTSKAFLNPLKKIMQKAGMKVTGAAAAKGAGEFGVAKAGIASLAGELATETPTQMVQSRAEHDLGLQDGKRPEYTSGKDWAQAFEEVFWPTVLTTGVMAGGAKATGAMLDARANKKLADNIKQFVGQADLTQLTDEQLANLQAATDRVATRKDADLQAAVETVRAEVDRRGGQPRPQMADAAPIGAFDAEEIIGAHADSPAAQLARQGIGTEYATTTPVETPAAAGLTPTGPISRAAAVITPAVDPFAQAIAAQGAERQRQINEQMPPERGGYYPSARLRAETYPTRPAPRQVADTLQAQEEEGPAPEAAAAQLPAEDTLAAAPPAEPLATATPQVDTPAPVPAQPVTTEAPAPVPTAAAPTPDSRQGLTAERVAFAQPYDVRLQQFREKARKANLTDEQIEALLPEDTRDTVTGFYRAEERVPTLRRAQEHIRQTGEPGVYIEFDISNLGGLNKARGHSGANKVYRRVAEIVKEELGRVPGVFVETRHGGDEFSAIGVGADVQMAEAAAERAQRRIAEYIKAEGLSDIPHTKEEASKLGIKGVGINFGVSEIRPETDLEDIFSKADQQVEKNKLVGGKDVIGAQAGTAGAVAPLRETGGIEKGTGGDAGPAGEIPQAEKAARATRAVEQEGLRERSPAPTEQPTETPAQAGVSVSGADTTASAIDAVAHQAATSPLNNLPQPTEAQKETGNYSKGHVRLHGLDISIENPKGSQRSNLNLDELRKHGGGLLGAAATTFDSAVEMAKRGDYIAALRQFKMATQPIAGEPESNVQRQREIAKLLDGMWATKVAHHYGYIKGTVGKDKDHIDVFLGPEAHNPRMPVFVVDQVDPESGAFDEHKVLMGFPAEGAARRGYLDNYTPGWKGLGAIKQFTLDEFKDWLKSGNTKKPVALGETTDASKVRSDEGRLQAPVHQAGTGPGNRAEEGQDQGGADLQRDTQEGRAAGNEKERERNAPSMGEGMLFNPNAQRQTDVEDVAGRPEERPNRFDIGRSLTPEQRRQVLDTLVDVYRLKNAPKEFKGFDQGGNERYGYAYSPELFEKSDITGALVRYYVTLPDGKIAHPSELFPDYTQHDIDAAIEKQKSEQLRRKEAAKRMNERATKAGFASPEADRAFWQQASEESKKRTVHGGWSIAPPSERIMFTKDGLFYSVYAKSNDDIAAMRAAGWRLADDGAQQAGEAKPEGVVQPFARFVERKGGALFVEGDPEALAEYIEPFAGKVLKSPNGVLLSKSKARNREYIPLTRERLPSGAIVDTFEGGGVMLTADVVKTGIARNRAELERLFTEDYGAAKFRAVFGKEPPAGAQEQYEESRRQVEARKAESERAAAREDQAKREAEEEAKRRKEEEEAALRKLDEERAGRWAETVGAGKHANPRYQAFLDTVEDPSEITSNAPYTGWIGQRVAEFEKTHGKRPFINADAKGWDEEFSRYIREYADKNLSERAKAQRGQAAPATTPSEAGSAEESEQKKAAGKIEDFGETLQGARKHYAQAYQDRMREAGEVDIAAEPLSRSWPEPDYQKLLDEGSDPWTVAFIHAARDAIPTKPQKGWKLKGWVESVKALRGMANDVLNDATTKDQVQTLLKDPKFARLNDEVSGRIDLYQAVGHEKSLKGISISAGQYSVFAGKEINPPKVIWTVEKKAKATAFSNWPTQLASGDTREEAIANFKKKYGSLDLGQKAAQEVSFDIYSKRSDAKKVFYIGKKIGKDYIDLKSFDTVAEARQYKVEHQDELVKLLEKAKAIPSERRETNEPRVGVDHRNGADVTPEQFSETFGFRGVQFGNYVEGRRRQADLNNAYDALMDLAGVLGIPPRALSLNGELGLAFGARGTGGKNAPAAHYEPGTVVINLTKREGAGSLAHEWWHALDNYFSRMRGEEESYVTEFPRAKFPGDTSIRPEMIDAFNGIMRAVNTTSLKQRATKLDRRRTKAYWSTGREMAARAFESYIIAKLQDQGASNDYLANIVSQEYWDAAAALGIEQEGTYPYLEAAEIPVVRAAFDHFFNTVETRETDRGVAIHEEGALYSGYERTEDTVQEPRRQGAVGRLHDDTEAGRRQIALFDADGLPTEPATARAQAADNFLVRYKHVSVDEIRTGVTHVETPEDAAHIFAPLRKHGQEAFLVLVVDKDGRPLHLLRHTKGVKDGSTVDPLTVVGAIAATEGAAGVWFAHNHPSGAVTESSADSNITRRIAAALDGTGVVMHGHIIVGAGSSARVLDSRGEGMDIRIKPLTRRNTIAITERVIRKQPPKDRTVIDSPAKARTIVEGMEAKTGLLLLDNRHHVIGALALSPAEMGALREGGRVRRILSAIDTTNAMAGIIVTEDKGSGANLARFLNGAGMRVLDIFYRDGGKLISSAERGEGLANDMGVWFARRIHGDRLSAQDYVVPETPEFDGNMTGDLAYTPKSAEKVKDGIKQLPIRLTVGVARDIHRGYGIEHIRAEMDRNPSREAPQYTDDRAENVVRQVAAVARSFNEIYREGDKIILRSSRMNEALVVQERTDPKTGESFYSVVTLKPARRQVWGEPVWVERGETRSDRLRQSGGPEPPPDQVEPRSDRQSRGAQTSKYQFSPKSTGGQQSPKVTVKKRRVIKPSDVQFRRMITEAWPRAGLSAAEVVATLKERLPGLSSAIDRMLARGESGKKGGLILVESEEPSALALEFARRTGRPLTDATVHAIARSRDGEIQGFYDPAIGLIFLSTPSLDTDTAPAVLLHEATHGQKRDALNKRALALVENRGGKLAHKSLREFLNRVATRMEEAGEAGTADEATAYIVELAATEGRQAGFSAIDGRFMNWVDRAIGKPVGNLLREFVAMIRAWGLRFGLPLNPTVDDLLALAKGDVKRAAVGRVAQETKDGRKFSRRPEGSSDTDDRQERFLDGLKAGQPIDRMFRLPFDVFGMIDSKGRLKAGVKLEAAAEKILKEAKFSTGRFAWINPFLEKARAGLIDRYGLSEEYKRREAEMQADERRIAMQAMDIVKRLAESGVNAAEARTLQAILTGERVAEGDYKAIAEPIRQAIDELGQEAVNLGLISEEAYQRNRATYLHRVYLKHEAALYDNRLLKWVYDGLASQRRKIIGNSLKGRGMDLKVEVDDLLKHVPKDMAGTLEQDLKGAKFKVLDLLEQSDGGRPKVLKRAWWPASLPVPDQFKNYTDRGTWEVRGAKGAKLILWRDFTKAERESMGEILDARYTIAKTFQLLAHDLATGRFFADLAKNPDWVAHTEPDGVVVSALQGSRLRTWAGVDWVHVPDVPIPKSQAKKYGALSGKWVRAEIWRDIQELDRMHKPGAWDKVLTQWKQNKVARSPVVHMNNVMSNLMLMDMADVRVQDLVRGIEAYTKGSQDYIDAMEHGAFGGNFVNQEIRRNILQPLLDEIAKENRGGAPGVDLKLNILSKLAYGIWRGAKWADQKMVNLYQIEDEVFRMATYMRRRSFGDSPAEAAAIAREQFLNYDIRAPWVNALRRSVLPFISYTYRAVPVVAQSIAYRPWKLAKYATLAYLANAFAYMLAPGDEDEERRSMRDEVQGYTWIGVPRMLRMPWRDAYGNPVFLDIRRWIPAGDVFDMNQGQSAVPIPAPLQFGGPMMLAAELMLNKQAFTGKEIINDRTDDWWDKTSKVADWAWKSWMPGAAWIPGSWYWEKIGTALEGGRDRLGRPYSLGQAAASAVGIKLQPQDVQLGFQQHAMEFNRVKRALQFELRKLEEDRARRLISEDVFLRDRERIRVKLLRLRDRAQETFASGQDGN